MRGGDPPLRDGKWRVSFYDESLISSDEFKFKRMNFNVNRRESFYFDAF